AALGPRVDHPLGGEHPQRLAYDGSADAELVLELHRVDRLPRRDVAPDDPLTDVRHDGAVDAAVRRSVRKSGHGRVPLNTAPNRLRCADAPAPRPHKLANMLPVIRTPCHRVKVDATRCIRT